MKLRKEVVSAKLEELFKTLPGNVIEGDVALPGCDGLVMYDTPLIGFASAADPLFEQYKDPKVIGKPYIDPDVRPYEGLYDYCIRCGACMRNCPKNAISLEKCKDQLKCAPYVNGTKKKYAPRYGCGKCQVGTPCESGIPKRTVYYKKAVSKETAFCVARTIFVINNCQLQTC